MRAWIQGTGDFSYFVRCRDGSLNVNTSDYPILFSTEYRVTGRDPYMPRVFMSSPTNNDTFTEGILMLSAAATDNIGISTVRFFLNGEDLDAEDVTPPYGVGLVLGPGVYTAFAVASDMDGNRATSTKVNFVVTVKKKAQ
ncbi:hypothetical protein A3B35_00275 [Candidatus Kaiserbacteria bacterium RIFCSPLOWO2_01_FULL_54_24]|uniref:Bacterial Ig-like domain-containing protein n=1 Tax=Candidatus Kaiserbacteria bacterium RIFCSPLOWO2_01_FULL_54_24 TaxID=1798515 RepID=A0A1F6ETF5_9BACT|nr:MAG: hypothetical protein A3B35_00275 [Candidatus Kaiserbacteria bacterium RIFCSPLOWO2_01_FULL_54_24]